MFAWNNGPHLERSPLCNEFAARPWGKVGIVTMTNELIDFDSSFTVVEVRARPLYVQLTILVFQVWRMCTTVDQLMVPILHKINLPWGFDTLHHHLTIPSNEKAKKKKKCSQSH